MAFLIPPNEDAVAQASSLPADKMPARHFHRHEQGSAPALAETAHPTQ
ncbi:MAG: hypothetical protein ONB46_03755 [candidate division KSB1 bacterium]|nr:hypothetical protein [candidate division KSB1 bacterium]MDZ7364964.1 hypothetical protein [candidate division KSB1 bacterium]MDZ7403359.1 hypothetical protein [candidate division KSB1 bacterium]